MDVKDKERNMRATLSSWQGQKWEGARLVAGAKRATRRLAWQWYQDKYYRRLHALISLQAASNFQ